MKITVEQRHIDNGTKGDCNQCAIALALKERGYSVIHKVLPTFIRVKRRSWKSYKTYYTTIHRDWIRAFDQGQKVEPTTFDLGVGVCNAKGVKS